MHREMQIKQYVTPKSNFTRTELLMSRGILETMCIAVHKKTSRPNQLEQKNAIVETQSINNVQAS